jgi:hypothetical protein
VKKIVRRFAVKRTRTHFAPSPQQRVTFFASVSPPQHASAFTSSKMSPDVYQMINTMRRFVVSVSYPVSCLRGEGKESSRDKDVSILILGAWIAVWACGVGLGRAKVSVHECLVRAGSPGRASIKRFRITRPRSTFQLALHG